MRSLNSRLTPLIGVFLLLLLLTGCGFQKTMTFPSPSGTAAVEMWQRRFENGWGARVELASSGRRIVLGELDRETFLYFVHVYWSPDETKVGILATGSNRFEIASDLKTGKTIPFAEIRREFSRSIRDTYILPPEEDPMEWANLSPAGIAFFKRHPEIHITYCP